MSISIPRFWRLAIDGGLLTEEQAIQFSARWSKIKGAKETGSAATLAEWLISERAITPYQSSVLLAGKVGPHIVGRYQILDRIPTGRFAGLFHAEHASSRHPFMLQVFRGPLADDQVRWSAAVREIKAVAAIKHHNLFQVYDVQVDGANAFAVAELAQGRSLRNILKKHPALDFDAACQIASQIANGVAQLHHEGQAHGEIRPENVWVEPHGNVKVLTSFLARDMMRPRGYFDLNLASDDAEMTSAANYLAPERANRNSKPTLASDLYAIGCVLFEMLTGRPPFASASTAETIHQHATANLPPLAGVNVPPKLLRALSSMVAKDPALRFSSLEVAAVALKSFTTNATEPKLEPRLATRQAFEEALAILPEKNSTTNANRFKFPPEQTRPTLEHGGDPRDSGRVQDGSTAGAVLNAAGELNARQIELNVDSAEVYGDVAKPESVSIVRSRRPIVIGFALTIAAAVVLLALFASRWGNHGTDPNRSAVVSPLRNDSIGAPRDHSATIQVAVESHEDLIDDDGATLWASPTSGAPVSVKYTPPGQQIFISLRPAKLNASDELNDLITATIQWRGDTSAEFEPFGGASWSDIAQLLITIGADDDGRLSTVLVLTLAEGKSAEVLAAGDNRTPTDVAGDVYHVHNQWAYYAPAGEGDRVLVISPAKQMAGIVRQGASSPPMRREFQRALEFMDSDRDVSILFAPEFLFADGRKLLTGNLAQLYDPLRAFFGEGVSAAALSLHWDANFFVELRIEGALDRSPKSTARVFQTRIREAPRALDEFVKTLHLHSHGQRLVARLPDMLRRLAEYTRIGVDDNQAMLRAYLPHQAGENLLLASELLLAEAASGRTLATQTVEDGVAEPTSIQKRLSAITSLSFPNETLEIAIQTLANDIGADIKIAGGDLQLDGITKNQSLSMDAREKPASEILISLLRLANPDKTATGPADPKQKLIYVIMNSSNDGEEQIVVTTRSQAIKRGDAIPAVFQNTD